MKDNYQLRNQHPCYNRSCDNCRDVFDDTYDGIRYFCVYAMMENMAKSIPKPELTELIRNKLGHLKMRNFTMGQFIDCAYGYAKYEQVEDE
jgi:hypothetical protein